MGTGGLQWDANDNPEQDRLNQKTTFVGTGAQIAALAAGDVHPGQLAFCTATGSGFIIDRVYARNAADSAWNEIFIVTDNITETAEQTNTPVSDNADFTNVAGRRYFAFFTLPTTEPFYLITAIEWKNGATVAGNITAGVDIIDADPPVNVVTVLQALCQEIAQSGTSAVQKNSAIVSSMIRGGSLIGIWVTGSSGTATFREQTGLGSQNQEKATSYDNTPDAAEDTAWTAVTARKYLKVYFRGYF